MAKMAKLVDDFIVNKGTEDDGDDDSAIHDCYVAYLYQILFANKNQPFLYSKVTAMVYVDFCYGF